MEMFKNIQLSFQDQLRDNNWIDNETKMQAIEKALSIIQLVGYSSWYQVEGSIDALYVDLTQLKDDSHFENMISLA